MKDLILRHTLVNAAEHEGKAEIQAVLGRVISEKPDLKNKIREMIPEIKETVKEVNSWSVKKQEMQMKKLGIKIEEKKTEEKGLPDLRNAEAGKVVMRLAPYPSGPLHIGNTRMILLNDEFVKKYRGKLFLVIDDTIGSEEKHIIPEAYDLILEGLKWLGVKYHELIYKSGRMEIFYKHAEEMIKKNIAYVCTCPEDILRENRKNGVECIHRNNSVEKNLELWKKMFESFEEGEAVVRLKTDMKHPNPAFRDRVLLRIADRDHPRVDRKYRVWPMLEFSWAIDDHLLGITHILRGKDLVMEDMMEEFIWSKLGWKKPEFIHYGMLNIEEAKLSKTESRKAIEIGKYSGWDDPRTWSLQSLKRRGIQPEAIRKFIIGMGLSLADVTVPAEILYAENRKMIDSESNRYFAVLNPVEISIEKFPKMKEVKIPLHPDSSKRGFRKINVSEKIYVEADDFEKFKNKEVGLINLFSVKLKREAEVTSKKVKMEIQKIQWVPKENVKIKLIMPDGTSREGMAESSIKGLKVNQLIQLVRIGFCRVDKADKDIALYYAHK
jgi:glutamyl-tRNA synthetase